MPILINATKSGNDLGGSIVALVVLFIRLVRVA